MRERSELRIRIVCPTTDVLIESDQSSRQGAEGGMKVGLGCSYGPDFVTSNSDAARIETFAIDNCGLIVYWTPIHLSPHNQLI